ncbi:MAG: efflux RND transporter periplasmic adaptor subunit [Calditrichota bacterium]
MKKPFKTIGILLAILIVAGVGFRIATRGQSETVESIPDIQKREGIPVRIETITPGPIAQTLRFSGTIEGEEQSVIVSRLMETITQIPVKVGQQVSRGQVVAKLDHANPQAAFRQARATLDNARLDLDRMKALYEQGAISKQMLDQAQLHADVAQSNFEASADMIELRTPLSGEVVRVHLQPGDVASPGAPVVTVAASRQIRVKFHVSPEERALITKDQSARIHPGIGDSTWISGIVEKVDDAADPASRLFEVTVRSDNPDGILRPGVLTTVEVVIQQRDNSLSVNREALMNEVAGSAQIFVVGPDKRAMLQTVTLGIYSTERVEVLTGVKPDDRVVVFGQNRLADGNLVKIIEI